ncbi:MAG: recombination protein RecR [Sphingomonadales bacterium]|nr:recombination protein RecR [Sphingomonadales bacterium]
MEYPSKLLEDAVSALSRLPGIGRKSALRLALFMLRSDAEISRDLSVSLARLRSEMKYCVRCSNMSDEDLCRICSSSSRRQGLICVVADFRDVMAIEQTRQFAGTYHVLGGLISPMDGVGPEKLRIDELVGRIVDEQIHEILIALSATMEGDTTAFYLAKRLEPYQLTISIISRGIAIGGELEYADELTLGRSIQHRVPFGSQGY